MYSILYMLLLTQLLGQKVTVTTCTLNCYRIMVLAEGQVQEYASPANLLGNENSLFHSMARDANLV